MINSHNQQKIYFNTLIILCIGYFVDFYDLTIFSASYINVFKDAFYLTDIDQIQQLYLKISNIYTIGIFVGAIGFGILGDKFGRSNIIRYSILIYSLAMIGSAFTHSIIVFTILRFISGVGLATEFATSSVLISELLPTKHASRYTALLYFCGILGGMSAIYLNMISWQLLYLCGGFFGLTIYLMRKKLFESQLFINLERNISKGNIRLLFNSKANCFKFIRLLGLIIPFSFLIHVMFVYPRFMNLGHDLAYNTQTLLFGFFIGNLISTLICSAIINWFKDYRIFIIINLCLFISIIPMYTIVSSNYFIYYAITLGLLGGGLPVAWIQLSIRDYGTNIRNTASNMLFACSRLCGIGFNLLISYWLINSHNFYQNVIITTAIITIIVIIALCNTKNNYIQQLKFIE